MAQWDEILRVGPVGLISCEDLECSWLGAVVLVSVSVLWEIFTVGCLITFMKSLFIVGMRLFVGGEIGCVRILFVPPYRWLRPDLVPMLHFTSVGLT